MATITRATYEWTVVWTVSGSPTQGTYWNGDPYVVGSCSLTGRTPTPTGSGVSTRHGGMINPTAYETQGYDGRIDISNTGAPGYDVALNAENSFPLALSPGQTLCSSISGDLATTGLIPTFSGNPIMLSGMAYLTCVSSAPASPSTTFRPAYAGSDKTVWTFADVNYGLLPNYAEPFDPIGTQLGFTDFHFDTYDSWYKLSQYNLTLNCQPAMSCMMPRYNMNNWFLARGEPHWEEGVFYPASWPLSGLAILTCSNNARRLDAVHRIIQLGIDLYGCMKAAGYASIFQNGAGFGANHYFAILFAGKMLNYQPMIDMLSLPWVSTGSKSFYTYGSPDFLGVPVKSFWETTTPYFTSTPWAGLDLPRPLGSYAATGVPLYGDPRINADLIQNDVTRDPAMQVDAMQPDQIAYVGWPLATNPLGWGNYFHLSMRPFAGCMIAATLLGPEFSDLYPAAARGLFERWMYDSKLWAALPLLTSEYDIDKWVCNGTGNGYMIRMWNTYKPSGPTYPSVTVSNPTLRVSV